ncbi:MAG: type I methionyl aminopeptidase [Clostridia bacterium]|nr:type I methionyl aminopeptidase [Clostridia bacterium]
MIPLKSRDEISLMRASGRLLARCMREVLAHAKPGVSTLELDIIADEFLRSRGAVPSFKDYPGGDGCRPFPGSICTSLNSVVVHGVPDRSLLKSGDVLSIDMGAILDGWHSDMARTVVIGGSGSPDVERLLAVTREAFYAGMLKARPGNRLRDISRAVQEVLKGGSLGIVTQLVGHGIGTEMHEEPEVPNYVFRGPNPRLQAGMVLAIEPMSTLGRGRVVWKDESDWPVTTADGTMAAHYENTVAVLEDGPEILTSTGDDEEV